MSTLNVLVVDDTIVYRKIVGDVLSEIPGVKVVGSANNGKSALHRLATLKPDLITLDIEMPEMNGLQVLEHIKSENIDVAVIMLSTSTTEGGEVAGRALELGALGVIPKPQAGKMDENKQAVTDQLMPIIETLLQKKEHHQRLREKEIHDSQEVRNTPARPDKTVSEKIKVTDSRIISKVPKPDLNVLVVDDTIVYRKIVGDVLSEIPGVKVIGSANNGKAALHRLATLKPDLITLDIEMPEMNGLQVLEHIKSENIDVTVIMLSTLTVEGGEMTIRALELGAFDFIPKPQAGKTTENKQAVADQLTPIIETLLRKKAFRKKIRDKDIHDPQIVRKRYVRPTQTITEKNKISDSKVISKVPKSKAEIIAIGISTGGPNALARMMPMLPANIGVPIVIVQHMPPMFTQSLAKSLNAKCSIEVKEAEHGEILRPNTAFIAPGGKQMKITAHVDGKHRVVKITDDAPVNSCKPSADYLFQSVASHYIGRATGVIMTGMGSDGAMGLKQMRSNGASIIAQNQDTCTVYGMPKEPIESGTAEKTVALDNIAAAIVKTTK